MINKSKKIKFILVILLITGVDASLHAAPSIAFNFFNNESMNSGFNYLETILPNSFASSLQNKHKLYTIKPKILSEMFHNDKIQLNKNYKDTDLLSISDSIDAEFFVFGSFTLNNSNTIELKVNIYKTGTTRIFSFTDVGYLSTDFFKLVDRISQHIKNITGESMLFQSENVEDKSRLAILTNVEGDELNSVYFEFLSSGYRISQLQGNSLTSTIDDEKIKKFYQIATKDASFRIISDKKAVEISHKKSSTEENIYSKYDFHFMTTAQNVIKKINENSFKPIDYLLIIGFDGSRSNAWVRCINLNKNLLILTNSEITGSTINEIVKKIIKTMSTEAPFRI